MANLGTGTVFSAVNSVFILKVGSENEVFVRTIQRVRYDLEETERLLRVPSIKLVLQNAPEQSEFIRIAIHTAKSALNEIGLYVERVRSDLERDGEVRFAHKVRWVLNDHGKLENRRPELMTCHQALTTVLNTLHPIELAGSLALKTQIPVQNIPPPIYTDSLEDSFIGPNQKRERRSKSGVAIVVSKLKAGIEGEQETTSTQYNLSKYIEPQSGCYGAVEMPVSSTEQYTSRTTEPDDNVLSRAWPAAPSSDISRSSNIFGPGPVNPWEYWNCDGGKEVYEKGNTTGSKEVGHWPAAWSMVALSNTMIPEKDHGTQIVLPEFHRNHASDEAAIGRVRSIPTFESEGQERSLSAAPKQEILHPTTETEEARSMEIPSMSMAEDAVAKPVLLRTKSIDFMSWLQSRGEDRSPDTTSPTAQPRNPLNSAVACYNRHHSMPSIANRFSASFSSSLSQSGVVDDQNQSSRIFRPRSQTNVPPRPMASTNRPVSEPTVPSISHHATRSYSSPTPLIVLPDSQDSIAMLRRPGEVGSGTASNAFSQSRRRRAMMEAAVGAHGS